MDLLGELGGFHTLQLMELAGLAVAHAVAATYPAAQAKRVVVVSGGGNNGGDGFIAARHLVHMGYEVSVWNPYTSSRSEELFERLLHQCAALGIPISRSADDGPALDDFDLVLDALRAPLDAVVAAMARCDKPVVSVDVPSGWDVDAGDVNGVGLSPAVLVSLTLPKLCALHFDGTHIIGGRFVPPDVAAKHKLALPDYPGAATIATL
ncbi:YjeF [Thecamonas trahens ATCC 50062]|uniref:NAD(P)H-hydrate epimerase n=1 Tax=Thecamonas trahens ATCC 50062 TaxID=461836 RepID=A0A0L0DJV8_THETB|nr:YjeF [Thecamonas trahens ATCC 50062]KNC52515.1 YjeF [Thecamonas trahens ATCC 50062]|eukprot:XP_013755309.1 YjeF [Thecamonas trahens ATCC 50062]